MFTAWISPTEEEILKREAVKNRVFGMIRDTCGDSCKPVIFGSTATGLFSPISDVDIGVLKIEGDPKEWVEQLGSALQTQTGVIQLKILSNARVCYFKCLKSSYLDLKKNANITILQVPLLKFIDSKTNIHVDITFGVKTGVKNTKLVSELLVKYPKVSITIL